MDPENNPDPNAPLKQLTPISIGDIEDGGGAAPQPEPEPEPQPNPEPTPKPDGDGPSGEPSVDPDPLSGLFDPSPKPDGGNEGDKGDGEGGDPENDGGDGGGGDVPSKLRKAMADQKARYEADLESARTENQTLRDQLQEARREAALIDPSKSPEVIEATNQFDQKLKGISRTLRPQAAREFMTNGKTLIDEYATLGEVWDEGYDDRYEAFRAKVDKAYGASSDEVMGALPDLAEQAAKVKASVAAAGSNNEEHYHRQLSETHDKANKYLGRIFDETLSYSEDLAKQAPLAPQNIVARLIESSEDFKASSEKVKEFLRGNLVPPRPLTQAQLRGMSPEDRAKHQGQVHQNYQEGYNRVYDTVPLAFHAMAALPVVAKMLQDARSELKDLKGVLPPSPKNDGSPHPSDNSPAPTPEPGSAGAGVRPITFDEKIGRAHV